MIIRIQDQEIECPDNPRIQAVVRGMTPMQAWQLHAWQKTPKNWPGQADIPQYCLYLGSFEFGEDGRKEKVDLYHHEGDIHYSAAIVFGDEGGNYKSGWAALGLKRDDYRELLRREFKCGLLRVDDLVELGVAALHAVRDSYDSILPAREIFRLGPEPEEDPNPELIPEFGMCWKCSLSLGNDLGERSFLDEIAGCKKLSKEQWKAGWTGGTQRNCPLLKKDPVK